MYTLSHTQAKVTIVVTHSENGDKKVNNWAFWICAKHIQIHIDPDLWVFQQISYKNETYSLTRLDFGLASAPKIMSRILKTVLEQDETVAKATSHYIDDILVDQHVHLQKLQIT